MHLEIGKFEVKDVQFGSKTTFAEGLLTIHKEEALQVIYEDERITTADLVLAKPTEPVRITPVKDAVEPRCKVTGESVYPGVTTKVLPVGSGRTHALKGVSVLAVGKHWGGFQDGLIDMSGPGAKQTPFSQLLNICLVADTNETFEKQEQQKKNTALRLAALRLAEYLAEPVRKKVPEEVERYSFPPLAKRTQELLTLPAVVYVLQLQSQMLEHGYNATVYGHDAGRMLPTLITPNEVLDGAVVSGSFMPASSKISTYQHVNNATLKRLMKEHGTTINFVGVILSNLNVQLEEKERAALMVAQLASSLGAEGAIVAEEGYGNPDTDFILTYEQLEQTGVKVVGITNECTGRDGRSQPLVDLSAKADAIISTGNVSEHLKLPPMERVIGELEAVARDGNAGGWNESIKEDGSVEIENNAIFCADSSTGDHYKTVKDY
ncbi:glycine/sarcosine/betaine reductase component B subunit [Salsuginibacillus kocurii]|uniref:glycine/sarcosine/betaine reductase component B subunit n=1 Tax=Salsuginibacillus kocurii TaxID=427078 RepID=UPI0003687FE9|nr:glycine/sarcosine/betaine reductase component B subunit [Salsuginibacillus kocurii]